MYVCEIFYFMDNFSKELIGACTVPILLSIISNEDSYGYEIIKKVKAISKDRIEFKDGTLYPVLHKLENKGLIESYWKITDSGRKRKYYRICQKGKKTLLNEKENWEIINQIISKLWQLKPRLT